MKNLEKFKLSSKEDLLRQDEMKRILGGSASYYYCYDGFSGRYWGKVYTSMSSDEAGEHLSGQNGYEIKCE